MSLVNVYSKARKHCGKVYPAQQTEFYVSITKGKIEVYRDKNGGITHTNTFTIGDEAEYSSYNLSYTGMITKITEKCVTIIAHGTSHRLDVYTFCWRNWNFNAEETRARNHEEMMYL